MNKSYEQELKCWLAVFDGEGEGSGAAEGSGEGEGSGDGDGDGGGDGDGDMKFSLAEVYKFMAGNKKALQTKNAELIYELESLKKSGNMSSEQKRGLEDRIENLQDELMTKEELTSKNQDKASKAHQKELTTLTDERDTWQKRYTNETIDRSIIDASMSNKAVNAQQIVAILRPTTTLQPVTADGEDTGVLAP